MLLNKFRKLVRISSIAQVEANTLSTIRFSEKNYLLLALSIASSAEELLVPLSIQKPACLLVIMFN